MLLLLAIGVIVALPAFGQKLVVRGGYAAFGAAALLATIIILIRWLTYPSVPNYAGSGLSAGADYGTYVALVLGIVAVVFSYLAYTAAGGTLNTLGAAFTSPAPQSPAAPAATEWQQPPQ
jgi:energy-coupling factor transporter transmembrane protein EcfT